MLEIKSQNNVRVSQKSASLLSAHSGSKEPKLKHHQGGYAMTESMQSSSAMGVKVDLSKNGPIRFPVTVAKGGEEVKGLFVGKMERSDEGWAVLMNPRVLVGWKTYRVTDAALGRILRDMGGYSFDLPSSQAMQVVDYPDVIRGIFGNWLASKFVMNAIHVDRHDGDAFNGLQVLEARHSDGAWTYYHDKDVCVTGPGLPQPPEY